MPNYFGTADQNEPNRFADPHDYILVRRPQILALNNTWVLSDSSVLALRFGMTRFPDNNTLSLAFDPATLGFSPTLPRARSRSQKFPASASAATTSSPAQTLGAINPTEINWKSTSANAATRSSSARTPSSSAATSARSASTSTSRATAPASSTSTRTSPRRTAAPAAPPTATPSRRSCSAIPSATSGDRARSRCRRRSTSTPTTSAATSQDDWRVSSKLTLNYGLRLEHETGLREENNNFTVGFDPTMTSALSSVTIPADPRRRHAGAQRDRRADVCRRRRQQDRPRATRRS